MRAIVLNHRYDNDDGDDSPETIKNDKNAPSAWSSDNDDDNEDMIRHDKDAFWAWSSRSPNMTIMTKITNMTIMTKMPSQRGRQGHQI